MASLSGSHLAIAYRCMAQDTLKMQHEHCVYEFLWESLGTRTCLELFHPGRRKQKLSEDVGVPKKAKLEEGKGNVALYMHML